MDASRPRYVQMVGRSSFRDRRAPLRNGRPVCAWRRSLLQRTTPGQCSNIVDADATKSVIAVLAAPRDEHGRDPHLYRRVLRYASLLREALNDNFRIVWPHIMLD